MALKIQYASDLHLEFK